MDGVFFLMSIIAVGLMMRWMVMNDRVPPDKPTQGIFAMAERPWKQRKRDSRNQSLRLPGDGPQPL